MLVVGKSHVRADKYLVFNYSTVPDITATFDGNVIANANVVFDEAVAIYVAVGADPSSGEYYGKLPDMAAMTYVTALAIGE